MRQNRTLYCGRIHVTDDIEEIVARHFAEWGQIERIRVLTNRGVAFITYTNEANSQFAKEAMANQSLDHTEILNLRWATTDPNPLAQKREAARIEEQAAEAVRRALPADFVAELEGRETPEMKRRRLAESGFGLDGYEAPEEIWHVRSKELELEAAAAAASSSRQGAALQLEDGKETIREVEDEKPTNPRAGTSPERERPTLSATSTAADTRPAGYQESSHTDQEGDNSNSIFSTSTLSRLKNHVAAANGRSTAPTTTTTTSSHPDSNNNNAIATNTLSSSLVAYDSDVDSD